MRQTMQTLLTTAALALGVVAGGPARAASDPERLLLRAFWVDLNGSRHGTTGTLDFRIDRWSTEAEVDHLRSVLETKGGDALLDALQKIRPRVGYVRSPRSVGWDLYYARQLPTDGGGRRILIATDRPLSFWERFNRPRSTEYGFSLAEIRLDKSGHGEGKLVSAARITYSKKTGTIEIENYETVPVRLSDVQVLESAVKKTTWAAR